MNWRQGVMIGLGASLLTACTVSLSGGVIGAVASIGLALLLFVSVSATQTGCVEDPPTRDDAGMDELDVGPCLRDVFPIPDAAIGPCLGAPLPDAAPDAATSPSDGGVDGAPDAAVGPCLEPPPEPEPPPDGKAMRIIDAERIHARIAAGLPPDVVARLQRPKRG